MMLHSGLSMLELKLDGATQVFTPEESLRASVVPAPTKRRTRRQSQIGSLDSHGEIEGAGECGSAGGLGHYPAACVLRNTHGERSGFLNNSDWGAGRVTALGQGMATVFVLGTELSQFRARLAAGGVCVLGTRT